MFEVIMKKKLIIYYSILLAIIIIPLIYAIFCTFSFINATKKNTITEQDFINKAAILNTQVANLIVTTDVKQSDDLSKKRKEFLEKNIKKSLLAKNDDLILRYINCSNTATAGLIFEQEYKTFIKPNSNNNSKNNSTDIQPNLTISGLNYNLKQIKKDLVNYTFVRMNNSYLAIISYDDAAFKKANEVFNLDSAPSDLAIIGSILLFVIINLVLVFILFILYYVPRAYIFKKANTHPIIAFVPFASDYFLCKIADNEGWKMVFLYIPVVQIVYKVILSLRIAKVFSKSELFGVGIFFAPIILLPIIAFDDSVYTPEYPQEEAKNIHEENTEEGRVE